jgi:hypothetical protein
MLKKVIDGEICVLLKFIISIKFLNVKLVECDSIFYRFDDLSLIFLS